MYQFKSKTKGIFLFITFVLLLAFLLHSELSNSIVSGEIGKSFDISQKDGRIWKEKNASVTYAGLELIFNANEKDGTNYSWDFGDDSTTQTEKWELVNHTYQQPNLDGYNVSLKVTKGGESATFYALVRVLPLPQARFEIKDANGEDVKPTSGTVEGKTVDIYIFKAGEKITFDASSSTGYQLKYYEWDFWVDSSGNFNPSNPLNYGSISNTEPITTFTYNNPGTYRVMLRVKDNYHEVAHSDIRYIKIEEKKEESGTNTSFSLSFLFNPFVLIGVMGGAVLGVVAYLWRMGYIYFPVGGGSTESKTESSSPAEENSFVGTKEIEDSLAEKKESVAPPPPPVGVAESPQPLPGLEAPMPAAFERKKCPNCGGTIPVPSDVRPLTVTCRSCGKSYKLKDHGKKKAVKGTSTGAGLQFPQIGGPTEGIGRIPPDTAQGPAEQAVFQQPEGTLTLTPKPVTTKKAVKKKPLEIKKCPKCGSAIPVYTDKRPIKIQCPGCKHAFLLKAKKKKVAQKKSVVPSEASFPGPAAKAEPRGAKVQDIAICPNCGTPTPVSAGTTTVVCESCRYQFQI